MNTPSNPQQGAERQRLADLLASRGADPERWPAADRGQLARLAQAPDWQSAHAEAVAVDALLAALPPVPAPSAALRRRILAAADAPAPRTPWLWLSMLWQELGGGWRAGPALAASLVLGVALASAVAPDSDVTVADSDVSSLIWSADDYAELTP